jgi:hypothetical protein
MQTQMQKGAYLSTCQIRDQCWEIRLNGAGFPARPGRMRLIWHNVARTLLARAEQAISQRALVISPPSDRHHRITLPRSTQHHTIQTRRYATRLLSCRSLERNSPNSLLRSVSRTARYRATTQPLLAHQHVFQEEGLTEGRLEEPLDLG